jgi:large subunit ribosomal protein L17
MRHGNKINHLGRKTSHRKAMLQNMACSLIEHKRISTTIAKAKTLRVFVEPILTKAKTDSTHSRRVVFSYLQNKEMVTELFREVAPKIANRAGGYTRIIRTGYRLGDNAEMCMIELVDYNELYNNDNAKKTTRRSRRSGAKKEDNLATEGTESTEVTAEDIAVVEDVADVTEEVVAEETIVDQTPVEEVIVDAVVEEVIEEAPVEEAVVEEVVEETTEETIEETAPEATAEETPADDESENSEEKA